MCEGPAQVVNRFIFRYNEVQIQTSSSVAEDVQSLFYKIIIKILRMYVSAGIKLEYGAEVRSAFRHLETTFWTALPFSSRRC